MPRLQNHITTIVNDVASCSRLSLDITTSFVDLFATDNSSLVAEPPSTRLRVIRPRFGRRVSCLSPLTTHLSWIPFLPWDATPPSVNCADPRLPTLGTPSVQLSTLCCHAYGHAQGQVALKSARQGSLPKSSSKSRITLWPFEHRHS